MGLRGAGSGGSGGRFLGSAGGTVGTAFEIRGIELELGVATDLVTGTLRADWVSAGGRDFF
jgi:hypothetical protein